MVEQPSSRNGGSADPGPASDSPVDLARIAGAIQRDRRLIVAIVLLVGVVVLVVSLLSPVHYRASARIADDPLTGDTVDGSATDRRLATSRELITTPAVLGAAARRVPGESAGSLAGKVSATVDPAASILDVAVSDSDPHRAARIANAVAGTFLDESERAERAALSQAQERMSAQLDEERRRGASPETIEALRARLGDIAAVRVMAGSGLRLVEEASAPAQAYAPRPLRSAVLAMLAALLVAVLIAVVRDRRRRNGPDPQTLSRALELPLIAALPVAGSRQGPEEIDGAMVEEAALQAAVRGALPPRAQRVVLVHGIGADAHAGPVAAALARSLSWAGHATVLVRADAGAERSARTDRWAGDVPVAHCANIEEQLQELKGSEYRYVIVESPAVATGAQVRAMASDTAGVLIVARLGRATLDDAMAARRLLDALALRALGLVLTCSAADAAAIMRNGFAPPARKRARSRSGGSSNGVHPLTAEPALDEPAETAGPQR
jgi:capsular polysaccharide biosynthesis protein